MRLGLLLRYRGNDTGPRMDLVEEAERLGYESVWSSEAYGTDAVRSRPARLPAPP
jgi:alkanesulfonate monooxygenase SsuD/methylene tetrahydromethanopterin reductase-like flavin-dependent oxidoreductase (luciferase family)